jgi:hypothetical protein
MTEPRYTTFSADAKSAALQSGESARDLIASLGARPRMRQVTVETYTATGNVNTKIRLRADARPWAVLLALAAPVGAPSSPVGAVGVPGFSWDATTDSVDVYEPSGLVADTVYLLQFLVVEV